LAQKSDIEQLKKEKIGWTQKKISLLNQAHGQGQTIIGLNGEVRRLKEKIRDLEGRFDRDPPEPNASIIDIRPTIGNSVSIFFF
jgi:hypothetical protein